MDGKELKMKILEILNQKKLTKDELRRVLEIKGEEQQNDFLIALSELEFEEKIILNEKGFYNIYDDDSNLVKGKIYIDKGGKGHFFGNKNDKQIKFLITNKYLNGALDGDLVLVRDRNLKRCYDCRLGAVEKVLKRHHLSLIFVYEGGGIFRLYNNYSDIYLKKNIEDCRDLVLGTLVVAKINETPICENIYDGEIQKVCGHIDDPSSLILAVSKRYDFDNEFCDNALVESENLPISVIDEDITGRVDLRDERIFTIDGADTKDIDDSIGIKRCGDNYVLKVNIADVAHYIKEGSFLDNEAYKRGCSVYPADTVLPMLPHNISNGICSLNPNVDRLAITGEIVLNKDFEVVDFKLYESIINSKKQMTYEEVNKVLDGEKVEGYKEFENDLYLLNKISKKLIKERKRNGALDFFSDENKIKTDNEGNIIDISLADRGDAERLIESFMILMNTEMASYLANWGYKIVYRVHPKPNPENMLVLFEELKNQGIENEYIDKILKDIKKIMRGKKIDLKYIQLFLNSIKNEEYYETISNLILRNMKRAYYSEDNIGHFGLATDNYIHFTSPIRRYADLTNHRIAKEIIKYSQHATMENYNQILERLEKMESKLSDVCIHISKKEVLADKVEEDVEKILQLEYFDEHLEDFEGPIKAKILNITKNGIVAKIDDLYEIIIPDSNLQLSNFKYRKGSRTYENKDESISLGDEIYVFAPEVFKEKGLITYTNVSKNPLNLLEKKPTYKFIKTKKIHI